MTLDQHFESLTKIIYNLSKAPTRRYKNKTLLEKLKKAKQIYDLALTEIELCKESDQTKLLKRIIDSILWQAPTHTA